MIYIFTDGVLAGRYKMRCLLESPRSMHARLPLCKPLRLLLLLLLLLSSLPD